MTQFADTLRLGAAYYGKGGQTDGGNAGFPVPNVTVVEFGAVAALTATGVVSAATATAVGANTLSIAGSLATAGVATFVVPRNVVVTATSNTLSVGVVVTGTDQYNAAQTELITATTTAAVLGAKAFKTVTGVVATATAAVTGTISVGPGDVLGLPFRLADKGKFLGLRIDGADAAPTLVAGYSSTGTSTASTADVRGTITSTTATDGTKLFTAMYIVQPSTKALLFGTDPA